MSKNNEGLRREVIGRVMLKPRGEWNPLENYTVLDCVVRKGSSYLCVKENISVSPDIDEGTYWQLLCSKGDKGEKGDRGEVGTNAPTFRGTWSSKSSYLYFDCVFYEGSTWLCTVPENMSTIEVPSLKAKNWQLMCKGLDYTLDKTGELIFYDSNKNISGVRTSTGYVTHGEEQLNKVINDMQSQINYLTERLKKYGLYTDGFDDDEKK